jgi:hypothetical protein
MSSSRPHQFLLATLLAVALAACSAAASPTPGPTATAAPTAAPTATPAPTTDPGSSATPAPAVDPAASLQIGSPYSLVPLSDTDAASFETNIKAALGSLSSLFIIGIRQVASGADIVGYVIVMTVPHVVAAADGSLDSLMGGVAGAGAEVVKGTVGGVAVAYITKSDIGWAAYLDGDDFVAAFSTDPTQAAPILAALIAANP